MGIEQLIQQYTQC